MYIWQYIIYMYTYIYISSLVWWYMSLLSVYYEGFWIQSPLGKAWESSNVPCASCRRSLKSCLGRGCAWHRARFLRGTKRSGMSKLKECRCGHYSQSKTETQFNSDSKDQKIYCIETELSKHKKWVHVWLYDSAEFSVYHLSPLFFGPKIFQGAILLWRSREEDALGGIEGGLIDEFWIREVDEKRPPLLAKDGNSGRGIPKV